MSEKNYVYDPENYVQPFTVYKEKIVAKSLDDYRAEEAASATLAAAEERAEKIKEERMKGYAEAFYADRKKDAEYQVATTPQERLVQGGSEYRKGFPMCTGLMDYFPDALAAVSNVSKQGNDKHNPGEEMHHARGKSMDHADCIMRHLQERGGFDGSIRHSAALAWRALALLQEELEREMNLPLPRGAR